MIPLDATLGAGAIVAGRYRIEALVGQGGFGVVYRATQLAIGRTVALKMLLPSADASASGRGRFEQEAVLAQRLEHPNTVRLYDFGEAEDGQPFIAWEFLKGRGLDEALRQSGPFPPARVARVAAQVLKSLMEAHGAGIIHRDIKPSNVFLCDFHGEADFVKVLDFGIAKSTRSRAPSPLTAAGTSVGTPAYMAPEQLFGGEIGPGTDLYALGLVMAELCAGRAVFDGASGLDIVQVHTGDGRVPIPGAVLASPLGPVIDRATRRSLGARFPSATDMLAAIEASGLFASLPPRPPATTGDDLAFAPTGLIATPSAQPMPATQQASPFPRDGLPAASHAGFLAPAAPPAPHYAPAPYDPRAAAPYGPPAGYPVQRFEAPRAPPRRGWNPLAILLGVLAMVAGLGTSTVVVCVGLGAAVEAIGGTRTAPSASAARRAAVKPGVALVRKLGDVTPKTARARLEAAGLRVANENSSPRVTRWMLDPSGGSMPMIALYRWDDATAAEATARSLEGQFGVFARDGVAVLQVTVGSDAAAARRVFDVIAP